MIGRLVLTVTIVASASAVAVECKSVVQVWTIMGATLSMIIAFLLPCSLYLKIRSHKPCSCRRFAVWLLLVTSIILMGLCSYTAILSFGKTETCVQPPGLPLPPRRNASSTTFLALGAQG